MQNFETTLAPENRVPSATAYTSLRKALEPHGFKPPVWHSECRYGDTRFIYFVSAGDLVKVGIATDVDARLAGLRAGAPVGLKLRGTREVPRLFGIQIERQIHAALSEHAIGREWFKITPKEARAFADPVVKRGWKAWRTLGDITFS